MQHYDCTGTRVREDDGQSCVWWVGELLCVSRTYTHHNFVSEVISQYKTLSSKFFAGRKRILDAWILDNLEFTVSSTSNSFTVLLYIKILLSTLQINKSDIMLNPTAKFNYCLSTFYLPLI
jgi:hypothetical protein